MTPSNDLDRATRELAARVPEQLAGLARLAYNYRWTWMPDGIDVFRDLDMRRWRLSNRNPVRLLQESSWEALTRVAEDEAYLERIAAVERAVADDLARPASNGGGGPTPEHPVAFFCAEYAIHASLPIYSGGLGALAGDILKEASDRAVPMVAVGLMYRRGYFRQRIDAHGWQQEYWVPTDPERTPAVLVHDDDGKPLHITIRVRGRDICANVWRVDVGRVPLYLLDTELPENDGIARWITSRLYDGDPQTRLAQYALLGVGGVAVLRALGIDPSVVHLNEGHAAFASLALAREAVAAGASFDEALEQVRRRLIFTTHTPVPAGNDTYPTHEVLEDFGELIAELGVDPGRIIGLGRTHPDDENEPFGVSQFALRTSRAANAVSRRHGEVARGMWHPMWPDRAVEDVPITHVTNGVHVPTWVGRPMRALFDKHLGPDWITRCVEPDTWDGVDAIPDEELWAVRQEQRRWLVELVREQSLLERAGRGEPRDYVQSAARAFDPQALTLGFARRLATYKRLHLLLLDVGRALALIAGDRPVQIVLAGKAHPRDDEGKRLVQNLFAVRDAPWVGERVVFLEDYDLSIGSRLVRGCDVWVNVPRPPLEASGTSGMKNAINGGLQLSVLDGWWAEGYDGGNGWGFSGDEDHDHHAQDQRDADDLYRLLEQEVVPTFYDRDESGIPRAWLARVKQSLKTLGPEFCAGRMVRDYEERMYRS